MKAIKIFVALSLFAFATACDSDSGTTDTSVSTDSTANATTEVAVELETKIEKGLDSLTTLEYQVDKKTGMKHGLYKEKNAEGKLLVERNYKQNKLDGVEKYYFENGQVDGEFTYANGQHHGPFKYYFESNGKLKQEGNYLNGQVDGILKTYYEDGTLKEEVNHLEGVTQGAFKEYNENGTLKAEGEFTSKSGRENLETGLLKMYDANGELNKKMICKEGQCCTIWTLEDGDVKPSNKLCEALVAAQKG